MNAFGAHASGRSAWWGRAVGRAMAVVWLLYLVFPVQTLLASPAGQAMRVLQLALAALFVAVYVYMMAGPRPLDLPARVTWPLTAALALLATVLCFLPGSNWLGLYIYVAASAGAHRRVGPAWAGIAATLVLTLLVERHLGTSGFGPGATGVAILATEIVAVGGLLNGLRRLMEVNVELRRGRDDAARLAVSEERLRFARDLHDLLGQHLAVIVLKSELTARLAEADPARAAREAREVEAVARTALRDVREAVTGYRHPRLDAELQGLRAALESAGAEVAVDNRAPPLPEGTQAALAWAAREAATNILRHSQATRVAVRLAQPEAASVRLEVVDNGPARPRPGGTASPGTGLVGLRERARRLGGSVDAGRTPDGGFRLAVTLPARAAGPEAP